MRRPDRSIFVVATTLSLPAFADNGFMGIPTSLGIGGLAVGALLIIGVAAVAGALYGAVEYIFQKIRGRK